MKEKTRMIATLFRRSHEDGQGVAEYALILGLIAVVAIVSLIFLGDVINDLMSTIGSTIDSST